MLNGVQFKLLASIHPAIHLRTSNSPIFQALGNLTAYIPSPLSSPWTSGLCTPRLLASSLAPLGRILGETWEGASHQRTRKRRSLHPRRAWDTRLVNRSVLTWSAGAQRLGTQGPMGGLRGALGGPSGPQGPRGALRAPAKSDSLHARAKMKIQN